MNRQHFYATDLGAVSTDSCSPSSEARVVVDDPEAANLIGSSTGVWDFPATSFGAEELHMPALDIDFPVTVRESETPGHHHVLIDVPMPWSAYVRLLEVLAEVGIIQEGYARASIERGGTFVATKPWKAGQFLPEPRCGGCERTPDSIPEYQMFAEDRSPADFVRREEGTFDKASGRFLCTACYIRAGMPSSDAGWRATPCELQRLGLPFAGPEVGEPF